MNFTKEELENLLLKYSTIEKIADIYGINKRSIALKLCSMYNTIEDFQEFVNRFKIKSPKEFSEKFSGLYSRASRFGLIGKINFSNKTKKWGDKLLTLEHYQSYIDKRGFVSIKDWLDHTNRGNRKYFDASINLGIIDKIKFKIDFKLNGESLKDIQEFINQKYIRSLQELNNRFPNVYNLIISKNFQAFLVFPALNNKPDFSWINSLDDFKNAIISLGITNRSTLRSRYYGLFSIGLKNTWLALAGLPGPNNEGYKFIKTDKDLQDYINTRKEITSLDVLMNNPEFKKLKSHILKNGFDISSLKFNTIRKIPDNFKIKNLETAQWLINYMGYQSPSQFKEDFITGGNMLYLDVKRLGIADKLIYPKRINKWSFLIKTENDIKNFIIKNDIKDYKDMCTRFSGLYNYLSDNKLTKCLSKYYTGSHIFDSSWEEEIFNYLKTNYMDFINLFHNIDLGCRDINPLPFDIVFEYKNQKYIIEILGITHFKEIFSNSKFLKIRKRDMKKKRWAENNGYRVLYYTKERYYIEQYGYPYYIYTNLKELIKDIRKD